MADVRSMLRQSREARRITHPHASYTSDSKIRCNLCDTLVKSEAAWQSHLHSSQHTLRQTRAQEAAASRAVGDTSKKRKAESQRSPHPEDRKKAKSVAFAAGVEEAEDEAGPGVAPQVVDNSVDGLKEATNKHPRPSSNDEVVDAVEMEKFERELAEMEASMASNAAEQATISAPAMTAEEVAAQAREEQSLQRGKRDVELEAEREDAAKMLEDEFDEMEGLEERVKRLRERREQLRQARNGDGDAAPTRAEATETPQEHALDPDGEDDEDDEEDDDDDWAFGAR